VPQTSKATRDCVQGLGLDAGPLFGKGRDDEASGTVGRTNTQAHDDKTTAVSRFGVAHREHLGAALIAPVHLPRLNRYTHRGIVPADDIPSDLRADGGAGGWSMAESDRERWDARYREAGARSREPSRSLLAFDDLLPREGRALDLAGGTGRHALWLARRGLDVTLADVSGVALEIAAAEAARAGLMLRTLQVDLEAEPLPSGPWDLIVCVDFLWRPLFATIPVALGPGGQLVVVHPTRTNLERHERPGLRHLLGDGELAGLVRGLEILRYEECWMVEGRHEARLVARRPVTTS
jgi:tellurite methyltransferase